MHMRHIYTLLTISLWLLLLTALPPCLSQLCSQQPYKCGGLPDLYYPFWGNTRPSYCGGGHQFNLTCYNSDHTFISMGSQQFEVVDIDTQAHIMTMVPKEYDVCSPRLDFSLSPLFWYAKTVHNITIFYDCPSEVVSSVNNFTCGAENNQTDGVYYVGGEDELLQQNVELRKCQRRKQVPADESAPSPDGGVNALYAALEVGFQVNYVVSKECMTCLATDGVCGRFDDDHFICSHRKSNALHGKMPVIIGVTGSVAGLILICITIWCLLKLFKSSRWQERFWLRTNRNQDIEAFLKSHGALTLKRYKFSALKKLTNSFKCKLGKGGFGVVYKGLLPNGCPVAIKILNPSKGNNEEFINEVASISKTSHVNVVTLLGFCLEGYKKALIYEFMFNGSLEKFICSNNRIPIAPLLSWSKLYQIAIGVARGLEYLHKGCNTRILHLDIKPHNILLDENFCPKISDFGLSKLCLKKESIISISDARGTIGYIAPEVWNKNFGGISYKSDVYSYGMMLLEIVGGRKKSENAEGSSSEYFPDWVYRRLKEVTHGEVATEENVIVRRMTMVGLWCIQSIPSDRPTMNKVLDMLEGNIDTIGIPPKHVMSSPVGSE
ncbi:LEAF RUST 10 DISEASE-RESISTANCE LOCUS RECEPTOR-LIKE PROTEIN KINASE-like 2.5 isoform X1 [Arachis stenosperma]|uniref:LEAF RUST 10 DISEASE-RESISTANCE LOCUS RECEPTOR-LIKE PROTEIN KINASE-like 2.5 isoform X1 n=1 Tax=Arachis stenosperma TaxID=217475 RepID=UPI0025AD5CAB|nr:LEAF RUST 10 DISEASE-RESISTANCE LOCUS RECEPTOR-LIKE PROTEIN KINASE-like 2.5 isoform X1 [Arachis stenosperma]